MTIQEAIIQQPNLTSLAIAIEVIIAHFEKK